MGAGANMSPGSQIRALTATNAKANINTISAGRRVERKNCTSLDLSNHSEACSASQ